MIVGTPGAKFVANRERCRQLHILANQRTWPTELNNQRRFSQPDDVPDRRIFNQPADIWLIVPCGKPKDCVEEWQTMGMWLTNLQFIP